MSPINCDSFWVPLVDLLPPAFILQSSRWMMTSRREEDIDPIWISVINGAAASPINWSSPNSLVFVHHITETADSPNRFSSRARGSGSSDLRSKMKWVAAQTLEFLRTSLEISSHDSSALSMGVSQPCLHDRHDRLTYTAVGCWYDACRHGTGLKREEPTCC
jgi:hypothetical protein